MVIQVDLAAVVVPVTLATISFGLAQAVMRAVMQVDRLVDTEAEAALLYLATVVTAQVKTQLGATDLVGVPAVVAEAAMETMVARARLV